ncbi:hypothetical protein BN381_10304 [Candidatus Microthrix parvicella RN1]|uniref:Uncharacterized protein n=1 Tax=Candidatus Neomicrothrix parvicella RN1 TaxID=1229780 RepID=R4YW25_9ACTN|nr:hypothetical protein BN381_10304 [Candidatus Microthrix parvicella RN1]
MTFVATMVVASFMEPHDIRALASEPTAPKLLPEIDAATAEPVGTCSFPLRATSGTN